MKRKFEIHMHSTFSDGEYTPTKLVKLAKQHKVSILSLTDHDSFKGMEEFLSATCEVGIMGFPGIEITVKYRDFEVHLLGYFKSMDSILQDLASRVEKMKCERENRMRTLIDKINEVVPEPFAGSILFENVEKAVEGVVGRPHLAREMVRLNIVKTTNEAFQDYLVPHNIEKDNIDIETAIDLIRKSRGVPVLAHPGERQYSLHNPNKGRDYDDIPEMVEELKSIGLLGLECVYPYHEKIGQVGYWLDLAKRYDLIATGSRDFHGFNTYQRNHLLGSTQMKPDFLERFQEVWG